MRNIDDYLIHKSIIESIDDKLIEEGFFGGLSALRSGIQDRNKAQSNPQPTRMPKEKPLMLPQQKAQLIDRISKSDSKDKVIDLLRKINDKLSSNEPKINTIKKDVNKDKPMGLYDRYAKFVNDFNCGGEYYGEDSDNRSDIDDDDFGYIYLLNKLRDRKRRL